MIKLALIGKDISHSMSQAIYEQELKQKIDYDLLDFSDENDIPKLSLLLERYDGISITSPYKKVFNKDVEAVGSYTEAFNTFRKKDNLLQAINTDYQAVSDQIGQFQSQAWKNFYLIGDGVMATLVKKILKAKNLSFTQFSRRQDNLKELSHPITLDTVIINTCAREYVYSGYLNKNILFWDMNYLMPSHVELFRSSTAQYIDGVSLLTLQAKYALSFWNLKSH